MGRQRQTTSFFLPRGQPESWTKNARPTCYYNASSECANVSITKVVCHRTEKTLFRASKWVSVLFSFVFSLKSDVLSFHVHYCIPEPSHEWPRVPPIVGRRAPFKRAPLVFTFGCHITMPSESVQPAKKENKKKKERGYKEGGCMGSIQQQCKHSAAPLLIWGAKEGHV